MTYKLDEDSESVQVLHDVALLCGQHHEVEAFDRLIQISDLLRFNKSVLLSRANQLGKCGEQGLDTRGRDVHEGTAKNS